MEHDPQASWREVCDRLDASISAAREQLDTTLRREENVPKSGPELRKEILDAAAACVTRDRQNNYGDAEDNFSDIATICNVLFERKLKEPLTATDVALFDMAQKLARLKTSPQHIDNWVDMAGYAACGGGIELRKQEGGA